MAGTFNRHGVPMCCGLVMERTAKGAECAACGRVCPDSEIQLARQAAQPERANCGWGCGSKSTCMGFCKGEGA